MKDSIHKYFQIGTISWMSYPKRGLTEVIRKTACDDFFDAIEIPTDLDPETRREAAALLRQSHMKVCCGA